MAPAIEPRKPKLSNCRLILLRGRLLLPMVFYYSVELFFKVRIGYDVWLWGLFHLLPLGLAIGLLLAANRGVRLMGVGICLFANVVYLLQLTLWFIQLFVENRLSTIMAYVGLLPVSIGLGCEVYLICVQFWTFYLVRQELENALPEGMLPVKGRPPRFFAADASIARRLLGNLAWAAPLGVLAWPVLEFFLPWGRLAVLTQTGSIVGAELIFLPLATLVGYTLVAWVGYYCVWPRLRLMYYGVIFFWAVQSGVLNLLQIWDAVVGGSTRHFLFKFPLDNLGLVLALSTLVIVAMWWAARQAVQRMHADLRHVLAGYTPPRPEPEEDLGAPGWDEAGKVG